MSSTSPQDDTPDGPEAPSPTAHDAAEDPNTDDGARPPVHERWWWTGAFRAALGGVVVGYQWQVISTGEAGPFNWVLAGIGGAVFVWGLWLVWQAYQARSQRPHGS